MYQILSRKGFPSVQVEHTVIYGNDQVDESGTGIHCFQEQFQVCLPLLPGSLNLSVGLSPFKPQFSFILKMG